MTTHSHCEFMKGHWHKAGAEHCSEAQCEHSLCQVEYQKDEHTDSEAEPSDIVSQYELLASNCLNLETLGNHLRFLTLHILYLFN